MLGTKSKCKSLTDSTMVEMSAVVFEWKDKDATGAVCWKEKTGDTPDFSWILLLAREAKRSEARRVMLSNIDWSMHIPTHLDLTLRDEECMEGVKLSLKGAKF